MVTLDYDGDHFWLPPTIAPNFPWPIEINLSRLPIMEINFEATRKIIGPNQFLVAHQ